MRSTASCRPGGSTARLPDRIGPARAAQLLYTAALIDAGTARDWSLVTEVVEADQLFDRAHAPAAQMSACSPEFLRGMKALVRPEARRQAPETRLAAEIEGFAAYRDGHDLREGLAAFLAKRKPSY